MTILRGAAIGVVSGIVALAVIAWRVVPEVAANGLLRPSRHTVPDALQRAHPEVTFAGDGLRLAGWRFPAQGHRLGTIVYLHGIADNRASALAPAERLTREGYDVIAYDGRAHGGSDGDICTYGFYEKRDLQRVLDTIVDGPIAVVGTSLGGAVALQAAAVDARISAVVAAESFSDLRTVATERAPWFLTAGMIRRAFVLAEKHGGFAVDDVSPMESARHITVPVLLVHGALDRETPPAHSERIFAALTGPRRLIVVDGAGHNGSLTAAAWADIRAWLQTAVLEHKDRNRP